MSVSLIFEMQETNSAQLQIRAGQRPVTASFRPLTAHIYHVMVILTGGFSSNLFLVILFLFPRDSFERS